MKMMLSACADSVQGKLIGIDTIFSAVSIDTRTLQPGALYIAIQGKQFDGHDFIAAAEQAGAIAVLVHKTVETTLPQIKVADTHLALAELAGTKSSRHQADPSKLKKAIVKVLHKNRVARLILDRRPPEEGYAWLKYEDDGHELEVALQDVQLTAIIEG